uniref:hypothetical protein n=1 Tax=Psychrobacter celer TaxID=306572 RepID=UPI001B7D2CB9
PCLSNTLLLQIEVLRRQMTVLLAPIVLPCLSNTLLLQIEVLRRQMTVLLAPIVLPVIGLTIISLTVSRAIFWCRFW